MRVEVDGNVYHTKYFPFFRIRRRPDFDVYSLRYPSGFVEEILVFDVDNYLSELREHLAYIIREYVMEDDEILTPFAQRLKRDSRDLFYEP